MPALRNDNVKIFVKDLFVAAKTHRTAVLLEKLHDVFVRVPKLFP